MVSLSACPLPVLVEVFYFVSTCCLLLCWNVGLVLLCACLDSIGSSNIVSSGGTALSLLLWLFLLLLPVVCSAL